MIDNKEKFIDSIRSYLEDIIKQGLKITTEDISSFTSTVKEEKYKEIFELDILFTSINLFGELERFYRAILKNIDNKRNGWNEFKPEFYIRLGFSLLYQDKINEGFAYILQGYNLNPHKIQEIFKNERDFDHFKYNKKNMIYTKLNFFTIYKDKSVFGDLDKLLNSFEIEEQFLILELVSQIDLHSKLIKNRDNLSSRRMIYQCLNQLCTLTESTLRENLININLISQDDTVTLKNLLKIFTNHLDHTSEDNWFKYFYHIDKPRAKRIYKSPNYIEFNHNLTTIKFRSDSNDDRKISKYFLYLYCVRNYSGHHFKFKHSRSEFLFNLSVRGHNFLNCEIVFWSIFGALYYINKFFRQS